MNLRCWLCVALLGISGFSGGCAREISLPRQHAEQTFTAQFGARLTWAGHSLPVQGAVQMEKGEGSLVLILPYGRTFGHCRYAAATGQARQNMLVMTCVPATGQNAGAQRLLRHAGRAVYRMLPGMLSGGDLRGGREPWESRFFRDEETLCAQYAEEGGFGMDMRFASLPEKNSNRLQP